ncbi:MAG: hypothetical protein MHM6MM_003109 [Cercozoa sp. M6MM]
MTVTTVTSYPSEPHGISGCFASDDGFVVAHRDFGLREYTASETRELARVSGAKVSGACQVASERFVLLDDSSVTRVQAEGELDVRHAVHLRKRVQFMHASEALQALVVVLVDGSTVILDAKDTGLTRLGKCQGESGAVASVVQDVGTPGESSQAVLLVCTAVSLEVFWLSRLALSQKQAVSPLRSFSLSEMHVSARDVAQVVVDASGEYFALLLRRDKALETRVFSVASRARDTRARLANGTVVPLSLVPLGAEAFPLDSQAALAFASSFGGDSGVLLRASTTASKGKGKGKAKAKAVLYVHNVALRVHYAIPLHSSARVQQLVSLPARGSVAVVCDSGVLQVRLTAAHLSSSASAAVLQQARDDASRLVQLRSKRDAVSKALKSARATASPGRVLEALALCEEHELVPLCASLLQSETPLNELTPQQARQLAALAAVQGHTETLRRVMQFPVRPLLDDVVFTLPDAQLLVRHDRALVLELLCAHVVTDSAAVALVVALVLNQEQDVNEDDSQDEAAVDQELLKVMLDCRFHSRAALRVLRALPSAQAEQVLRLVLRMLQHVMRLVTSDTVNDDEMSDDSAMLSDLEVTREKALRAALRWTSAALDARLIDVATAPSSLRQVLRKLPPLLDRLRNDAMQAADLAGSVDHILRLQQIHRQEHRQKARPDYAVEVLHF